jgi:hypothetical protein
MAVNRLYLVSKKIIQLILLEFRMESKSAFL